MDERCLMYDSEFVGYTSDPATTAKSDQALAHAIVTLKNSTAFLLIAFADLGGPIVQATTSVSIPENLLYPCLETFHDICGELIQKLGTDYSLSDEDADI